MTTINKLLRQTANKFRGRHSVEMDAQEFTEIFEHTDDGGLADLSELIGQDLKVLEGIVEQSKLNIIDAAADKANQQYNETQKIEADAKKVKKRHDEESDGKTRCPKCGYVY
jgi:hypothetical protein